MPADVRLCCFAPVHVPFSESPVRVVVGLFPENSHSASLSRFGGGGYAALEIAGDTPFRFCRSSSAQ